MKWQTKISTIQNGEEIIRGKKLGEMMQEMSFSESIYFLLTSNKPTTAHLKMFDAVLVAAIDHGLGTPSTTVARTVMSTKNSMHVSVAAGLLAMGEKHGSAIESAGKFFQENKSTEDINGLVKNLKDQKIRIPGYGHPILDHDLRSDVLFELGKKYDVYGAHCRFAVAVGEALDKMSSKKLPLNIDGSMAAILSDMGFDWQMMKGLFMVARLPGLVAHSYEEKIEDGGIRRVSLEDCEYNGL